MPTWFITGCSTGLGRALAEAVLQRGYNAVVTARDAANVQDLAEPYPDTALALPLDVTGPGAGHAGGAAARGAFRRCRRAREQRQIRIPCRGRGRRRRRRTAAVRHQFLRRRRHLAEALASGVDVRGRVHRCPKSLALIGLSARRRRRTNVRTGRPGRRCGGGSGRRICMGCARCCRRCQSWIGECCESACERGPFRFVASEGECGSVGGCGLIGSAQSA